VTFLPIYPLLYASLKLNRAWVFNRSRTLEEDGPTILSPSELLDFTQLNLFISLFSTLGEDLRVRRANQVVASIEELERFQNGSLAAADSEVSVYLSNRAMPHLTRVSSPSHSLPIFARGN